MRLPEQGELLEGKYQIDGVLGEGGFGRVVSATTVGSGRRVAIKMLKNHAGSTGTHAGRFLREMRAIAALSSPHTLTLFDYGRTPDGILFMVTELVDGEDLSALLARRDTFSEGDTVHILLQVLDSLREAHQIGVLHRDIKPSNIRIYPFNDDPLRVKVLDFGLAKTSDPLESRLTGTGKVIGTPRYMSPEQLFGADLTPATDVYSTGLLALEMLKGRQATVREFPPQRELSLGAGDAVGADLRAIVNRMLAGDVRDRYRDAGEVVADLRRLRRAYALPNEPEPVPREPVAVVHSAFEPAPEPALDTQPRGRKTAGTVGLLAIIALGAISALAAAYLMPPSAVPEKEDRPLRVPTGLLRVSDAPSGTTAAVVPTPVIGICDGRRASFSGSGAIERDGGGNYMVYVPASYDGRRRMPVILYFAKEPDAGSIVAVARQMGREIPAELEPDRTSEQVIAATLQDLAENRDMVVALVQLGGPGDDESAHRVVDAVSEALCVDPDRIYGIAASERVVEMVSISCALSLAGIVTVGSKVEPPSCRMPHLHFFQRAAPRPVTSRSRRRAQTKRADGTSLEDVDLSCSGAGVERSTSGWMQWMQTNGCATDRPPIPEAMCDAWDCAAALMHCEVDGTAVAVQRGLSLEGTRCVGGFDDRFDYGKAIARFFELTSPR